MTTHTEIDDFTQRWNDAVARLTPLSERLGFSGYKSYSAMSEETTCFSAQLTYNGKKVAHLRNEGQGGCTSIYWTNSDAGDEIMETFNRIIGGAEGIKIYFEGYISELAEKHNTSLKWSRFCRTWSKKGWTCFLVETSDGFTEMVRVNDGRTDMGRARKKVEDMGVRIIEAH
jgi:hypothetical protein